MVLWFIKLPSWSSKEGSHPLMLLPHPHPNVGCQIYLCLRVLVLSLLEGWWCCQKSENVHQTFNSSDWWGNLWDNNVQTHGWHQLPSYWILTLWIYIATDSSERTTSVGGKENLARWTRVAQRLSRPSKSPWKCPACILFSCQVYTARGYGYSIHGVLFSAKFIFIT